MSSKSIWAMAMFLSFSVFGQQTEQNEPNLVQLEATIRGDKEQPNVLSIVPWQLPQAKSVDGQVLDTLTSINFQPLTRAEFQRELATYAGHEIRVSEGQPEH